MTMPSSGSDAATAVDYDPFAGAALARVVPTTESQREIWLASQLEPGASLAYNEAITLHLRGALDVDALKQALQALLDRHQALRAALSVDGGEILIAEHADLPWSVSDVSAQSADARADALQAMLTHAVETPFDLAASPLLRVDLLRLGEAEHVLVLATHHLVCDGWSFGVIVRELAVLYGAARRGAVAELPPSDSFADFCLGEIAHRQSADFRADEHFWLERFSQVPAPLELPLDRPRPRRRGFASKREDVVLDASLISALRRAGAKHGASLYATLLAGFAVLVSRLSGQDDVVIGIPAAGQAAAGQDALVGHAVNVLPLRARIDAQSSFADTLGALRSELLDAFEHQRYTVGSLLKRLSLARDPARLPLVSLLFNLDPGLDDDTLGFVGLDARFAGVPRSHENFEIFINAVQVDGGLRLECQYSSALFDPATIARWLDAYASLLQAVADGAQSTAVARLPLLSARARAELHALQPVPLAFERTRRVEELFFAAAARVPQSIAVQFGETSLSYAQLAQRARAIATALRDRGAGDGMLIGVMVERSPDMLAALLGVLATGATYVPLDPAFPRERLDFMVADAELGLLLTDTANAHVLDVAPERVLVLDANDTLSAAGDHRIERDADAVAYVIYTSGSTGKPKGVRVPHRAVVNFLASMRREPGLEECDRLLAVTTLSFDIAVLELLLPLTTGACVVLASRDEVIDGRALAALIDTHSVSVMQATPATWRLLIEAGWQGRSGFKALCGGEALPLDLAAALLSRCASLWNMYGPTETTVWSTCARIESPLSAITIGRPIDNTTVWILDTDAQACAVGMPGEIAIGGEGVTLGYLDRHALTADRFIPDPLASTSNARLYRTGDRGRWRNDGMLEHLGRLDFQVKLRGFRIELGDVESNLVSHPSIARAVVIVREDRAGDQRLVAYVTLRERAPADDSELRAHLRARLPEYMLPQHFIRLDAIPQLPNGKIDRARLPSPMLGADIVAGTHVAPRDAIEQRIATAMEHVLSLPGIGVHDSFFALGGHSLLAAQLTTRLSREFDLHLSLGLLFEAPTVAALAATIRQHLAEPEDARAYRIATLTDPTRAPLSLLQTRLWLFEQLNPGTVVYNTPSAHRLRGVLDEDAFAGAFDDLVQRQSILRTSIEHDGSELVQRIHERISLTLFPAEDLSRLPADDREAVLLRRLDALTDVPIALDQAPLFRARLFRLAADEHVLFFMPHHIIWDGWSFDVFYAEFAELYAARRDQRCSKLIPLAVSYGDFSQWHAQWLTSTAYTQQFGRQLAHWRQRLQASGTLPALPTDMPRPSKITVGRGATEWLEIPLTLTDAARAAGRLADATLYMTLLAVYYVLLWRAAGSTHLVVGTPVRVRASSDLENVMGLFTNLLPVPLDIDPGERFVDLVARVKTVVLESLASPDVQLEDLMREPGMRELAGANHFYQAQFSYQDARQRNRNWAGLEQEQVLLFQRAASEDLAIWFLEHGDGMTGGVLYNADLFEADSGRRFAAQYIDLLERAVAAPECAVAHLSRVAAGSFEAIDGEATPLRNEGTGRRLEREFEMRAEQSPEQIAIRVDDSTISYAELDHRASRIAACLRSRGVVDGTLVALCTRNDIDRVAVLLAALKSGATCLLLDPAKTDAQLAQMLVQAGASVIVADSTRSFGIARSHCVWLDADAAEITAAAPSRVASWWSETRPSIAVAVLDDDGAATVQALSHRDVGGALDDVVMRLGIVARDVVMVASAEDDALCGFGALLALRAGATLVPATHVEATRLVRWVDAHGASVMLAPRSIWTGVQQAGGFRGRLRCAVAIDRDRSFAVARELAGLSDEAWVAPGPSLASIPFCTLQRAPQPGDRASMARAPLASLHVRVIGEDSTATLVGNVGDVSVTCADGIFALRPSPGTTDQKAWVASTIPFQSMVRARWLSAGRLDVIGGASAVRAPISTPASPVPFDEPMTVAERWLAEQWRELIGVPRIAAIDNFFDLGGHSLLAMTLLATVEKQTGVRLGLLKLANGSLRAVAAEIPERAITDGPVAAPGLRERMLRMFGIERKGPGPT